VHAEAPDATIALLKRFLDRWCILNKEWNNHSLFFFETAFAALLPTILRTSLTIDQINGHV
jgi:hypothetical protein